MAHVFDHGLAAPLRTLVRDGVAAALHPLLISEGGYLRAVEKYGGVVRTDDEATIGLVFETLNGRAPAALVALAGKTTEEAGNQGRRWSGVLTVQVILFSNHGRDMVSRLAADVVGTATMNADPGLDVMLEHVEQLLIDNNLGIGTKAHTLMPVSEDEISSDKEHSIWMQTYQVRVSRDVLDHRTALQRIREFMTTWRAATTSTDTPSQLGDELTTVSL